MGSGGMMGASMMEHEMKGLHMAMKQLSPADHATLMKMMNDYLLSKGIDPAKYAEMRDEIKDMRQENRTEMKDMRKQNQQEMKAKREEMRSKIKEVRGNGKVNVQDISMTR